MARGGRRHISYALLRVLSSHLRNAFENVICEMASILSRPQCDNGFIRVISAHGGHPPVQLLKEDVHNKMRKDTHWVGEHSESGRPYLHGSLLEAFLLAPCRDIMVEKTECCFTNISQVLQNNLSKIYQARIHIYGENFKLKLYTCAQSMALGTRTNFQLEILMQNTNSAIHKFQRIFWRACETLVKHPPGTSHQAVLSTHSHNEYCLVDKPFIRTNMDQEPSSITEPLRVKRTGYAIIIRQSFEPWFIPNRHLKAESF